MRTREIMRRARKDGRTAGENAASWAFDGNTPRETYERVLRGIENGDPETLDAFRTPNLSGEDADNPTPGTLAEAYDIDERRDPDGTLLDQACTEWENAASQAFWFGVERECRRHVEVPS
jgi:hypothetical protein